METYTRHFVSQHLGKAKASVDTDGAAIGRVRITVPRRPGQSIDFTFATARLAQLQPAQAEWSETVARIAIHQAHRLFQSGGEEALFCCAHDLLLATPPWQGDLEVLPYGGATAGFAQRSR